MTLYEVHEIRDTVMAAPERNKKLVVLFRNPASDGNSDQYHKELQDHGCVPVSIPVLSFQFDNLKELAQKMRKPESYRGLVLTSQRAVEAMEKAVEDEMSSQEWKNKLSKAWQKHPIFVVGRSTAKSARENLGFENLIGEEAGSAEKLLPVIYDVITPSSKPLLYPCGNLRRDTIPNGLASAGIELSSVQVYSTCSHPRTQQSLHELVDKKGVPSHFVFFSPSGVEFTTDILRGVPSHFVFFSPSGVEFTTDILRAIFHCPEDIKMVAIGNTTSKALKQKNWTVAAVAEEPSPQSLARCILGKDGDKI